MFVREKKIGAYRYLYLVESVREAGRVKQRVIKNLGRKEVVQASGELDRLARSLAKVAQRSLVLSLLDGETAARPGARRIGPALLFERLWEETGCRAVIDELLASEAYAINWGRYWRDTVTYHTPASGNNRRRLIWIVVSRSRR